MKDKLSKFEAISLIIIIAITQIILNLPEYIVDLTGTGAIINVLYIFLIGIIICTVIYKLSKNFPSMDIIDIAENLGGNILKFILSMFFILFFLLLIIIAISNFTYILKSLYFSNYSTLFLVLFFVATIIFSNLRRFYCNKKSDLCFYSFTYN